MSGIDEIIARIDAEALASENLLRAEYDDKIKEIEEACAAACAACAASRRWRRASFISCIFGAANTSPLPLPV